MTSWSLIFTILLSGGGSNDLLTWMPTADYWKAKGVTVSASAMLAELKAPAAPAGTKPATAPSADGAPAPGPKAAEVRRLMAIRTLGELKAKEATAALKGLTSSKDAFVAEYAQAALAAIEGKAYSRPRPTAEALQKDVWLLPQNCGLVAQASPSLGTGMAIDKVLESMGESIPADQKDAAREKVTEMILAVAEKIGNARLDAMTMGVPDDVGSRNGYVAVIARGQYDRAAMKEMLRENARGNERQETIEGAEFIGLGGGACVLMPSADQFIFLAGPKWEMLPIAEMAKAVKAGKGGLADNPDMVKLLKTVDMKKPLWGAARVTEAYTALDVAAGFQTGTLTGELKNNAIELKLAAHGGDPNAVQECVSLAQTYIQDGRNGLQREIARMPMLQGLADFLDSIKFEVKDGDVTGTATLKEPAKLLMLPFVAMRVHQVPPPRQGRPAPGGQDF